MCVGKMLRVQGREMLECDAKGNAGDAGDAGEAENAENAENAGDADADAMLRNARQKKKRGRQEMRDRK